MIKNNTFNVSSVIIEAAGYNFDMHCNDEFEVITINSVGNGYEVVREFKEDNIFDDSPVKMWKKTLLDSNFEIVAESGCMSPNAEYDEIKKYMGQL